jgi:hypothetical protein
MVPDQPEQKQFARSHLNRKSWAWWHTPAISVSVKVQNRRIVVQAGLGKKRDPISGLDYEHMIKARAHKGGVRIGKTPKKLASICCP